MIQEIYALSLGHFVIRSLMFEAAATVGLDPDRLSFTGCFQILKCRLPECDGKTPARSRRGIKACSGRCKGSGPTRAATGSIRV